MKWLKIIKIIETIQKKKLLNKKKNTVLEF